MVGAVVVGRLTDRLGRSLVFKVDLALFVLFAIGSALAPSIAVLVVFRFLLGMAIGADYPISAAYVAEIAPLRHRSRMLVDAFSFQAVGQLVGVGVGLLVLQATPDVGAWRWMLAFGAVPALVIALLRRGTPESPRWLVLQARVEEACEVTSRFVRRTITVEQIVSYGQTEEAKVPARALFGRGLRRRTVATTVPWFLMDIATYGIGVFTPTILAAIGVAGVSAAGLAQADQAMFIAADVTATEGALFVDLFLVVGFALAIAFVGRISKATLQVVGFVVMAASLGPLALVSSSGTGTGTGTGTGDADIAIVLLAFAAFNLFMNMGPNATTFALPAEVFPTSVRATGHGLAAASGKAGAAVGLFFFPILQSELGRRWTLLMVAAGAAVAAGVTARLRRELSPGPWTRSG